MLKRQCGVRRLANARTTRSSFRSNSTDVSSVKTDETAPLKLTADLKHSLKESSANLQEDSQLPADSIRPLLKSQRRKLLRKLKKLSAEPQGRDAPDSPSAPNSNNETIPENIEKASQDSASDSAGWAPEPWGMITNHFRSFKSSEDSTSPIIGKQSKRIKYAGKYKSDMKDYEGTPTRFTTKHADSELPPSAVLSGIPRLPLPHSRSCEGLLEPSKELFTLKDVEPPSEHRPVATLAHGLDRVLFNPGVHWLQDPRSRVYNFTPWLQKVPRVQDFAFNRISGFIKSSQDNDLQLLARQEGCKFTGSTSSLTGLLGQIYFMLSAERRPKVTRLSNAFHSEPSNFTPGQRLPVSIVMRYNEGVYSIDSDSKDPGWSEKNILTWMGTMLEKFLTVPEEDFSALLRHHPPSPEQDSRREAYRYAKFGNFMMRSQLDCHDPRLPGTGIFDIKTRAALPIRLDMMNLEENSGYLIRTLLGRYESFEREYYDLIRSAFLKYSLQARIGNMDGVLVTYHNTSQIFGFEYVTLEDMDECLYGNKLAGNHIFECSLKLLNLISEEITLKFPEQDISVLFDAQPSTRFGLYDLNVWAQPSSWDPEKGEKPTVQFDISAVNYIGSEPIISYFVADHLGHKPWSVHWKIQTSNESPDLIRANLQRARDAQVFYWNLPTGVGMAEMEGRWHAMNYGNTDRTTKVAFPDALFKHPDASIKFLRRMARMGRQDSEKWDQEEVGKPKILLQETRSNYDGAVVESHSSTTDGSSQNEVDPMALVDTTPASVTEQHDAIDNVTEEPQGEEHSPETSVTQDPSLATPGSSRS